MNFRMQFIDIKDTNSVYQEDALVINKEVNLFGVIGGNPASYEYRDELGKSGTHLASQQYQNHLEHVKIVMNLSSEVEKINQRVKRLMVAKGTAMKEKHFHWQISIGIIYLKQNRLHYIQIGDVDIVVKTKKGDIKKLGENNLLGIEKKCEAQYGKVNEVNIRKMANTRNGYGIMNGNLDYKKYIQTGSIELSELSAVFIVSKGLSAKNNSYKKIIDFIEENGLIAYYQKNESQTGDKNAIYIDKIESS